MNESKPVSKPSLAEMSKRWTHAESDERSIPGQADKLGRADISSWSHATSKPFGSVFKPIRPNENDRTSNLQPSAPIRSLAACEEYHKVKGIVIPHDPSLVVMPSTVEFDVGNHFTKQIATIKKAGEMATKFYKEERVQKTGKPIEMPKAIPDDAFTPISPEALEDLRKRNPQVPRD